jgi:DNA-binding PadR family transcriptional regulator
MAAKRSWETTELEGNVLGLIATKGPCTTYAMRREFQRSPSPYWSGSAGAIYPLMSRLRQRRLIRVTGAIRDGRGGRLYMLTPRGRRVLQRWLGRPLSPLTIGVPPDPLRNRVQFFALLAKAEQRAFLADAAAKVKAHLADLVLVTERQKAAGDTLDYLINRGACRVLQARLDWLQETAETLQIGLPGER